VRARPSLYSNHAATHATHAQLFWLTLAACLPAFCSTGVTSLLLLEGDVMLLVGTSNGATLVVTDPVAPPPRPMWEAAARKLGKQLPMQYD
jgi:hypothetical protein